MDVQGPGWLWVMAAGAAGFGIGMLVGRGQQRPGVSGVTGALIAGPQASAPHPYIAPVAGTSPPAPVDRSPQELSAIASSLAPGVVGNAQLAAMNLSPSDQAFVLDLRTVQQNAQGAGNQGLID